MNKVNSTPPPRISWIDIAKGLGIFLVIIGHTVLWSDNYINRFIYNFIYSFHMPLFFIISGMLIKNKKTFSKFYVKKISHAYLTPYIVYSFASITASYLEAVCFKTDFSWGDSRLYHITSLCGLAPFWFLLSLFFAYALFNYILEKINYSKKVIAVFLIICILISLVLSALFPSLGDNWFDNNLMGIFRIFPILAFFALGYLFKNHLSCAKKYAVLIVAFSFVMQVLLCHFFNENIDLQLFILGNPIIYFVKSINGSIMIIYLSQLISQCKFFLYIGKKTKEIMIIHTFYFTFINRRISSLVFSNTTLILLTASVLTLLMCLLIDKLLSKIKLYRLSMGFFDR